MPNQSVAPTVDITWIARIALTARDRPTSAWLPPGTRLVGPRFNDPVQPEWMDDAEWSLRALAVEGPALRASNTRLKSILCESSSIVAPPEVIRASG